MRLLLNNDFQQPRQHVGSIIAGLSCALFPSIVVVVPCPQRQTTVFAVFYRTHFCLLHITSFPSTLRFYCCATILPQPPPRHPSARQTGVIAAENRRFSHFWRGCQVLAAQFGQQAETANIRPFAFAESDDFYDFSPQPIGQNWAQWANCARN